MFNEQLTLSDGTNNHAYSTVITGDYKRVRRVPTSDLNTPELMTISHQDSGNKSRSLIRFDKTIESVDGLQRGVLSLQLVISIPRDLAVEADVQKVYNQLDAFMATSGYLGKIVNLES